MSRFKLFRHVTMLSALLCFVVNGWGQVTLTGNSYSQNFDGVGTSLPTGWTCRTGSTATVLGTSQTFVTTATQWSTTTGQFQNSAASESPSVSTDAAATQSTRTDRVIAVRQIGASDPGSSFIFQIANTTGFNAFNLSFKLMQLDPGTAGRSVSWNVDYGFGATPTSFTNATTSPTALTTTTGTWGSTNVTVNFGTVLDNNSGPVWIRIVAKSGSSGTGSRPVTAVDDFSLSWSTIPACSGTPSPGNTLASVNPAIGGSPTTLSLQNATSGTGVAYQWQSSSNNSSWTDISGATSATYSATPSSATYYRCNVTCSGNTGASNSILVNLTYCTPSATTTTYYITGVSTTNGISNITNTGTSYGLSSGFSNYSSSISCSQLAGSSISFSIALAGNATSSTYSYGVALWVDWNNNFAFETSERMYNSAAYIYSVSSSFVIPVGTTPGNYRMRVVADYNATSPTACAITSGTSGECEDYTITVPANCAAPTSLAATAASTSQTSTTIASAFTAAASSPTGYLVIRTETNSQPIPVNGTVYTVGTNAIGYIEYVGASAGSWNSSSLLPNTTYYYWVFSYNSTTCSAGPAYSSNTTNFSQSTTSCTGAALANLTYTTSTASYCNGSAITSNTATLGTTSGVPTYTISPALPTGLSLSTSTGTISGTPTAAVASTNYTVTADNGCTNTTATLNLTTNALPATPASSAATLAGTYGFTANWIASAGATAYFLDVSTSSSFTSMVSGFDGLNVGSGTSYVVTGLGSGTTYYYRVRSTNGTCNSLNSSSITIATTALTSVATGNWNSGSTWSGGQVPTCNDNVTIQSTHNVTVNSSSNVSKNLTIASGGTLTVASGDLTVGCTLNNTPLTNNGTLNVSGGTLNVNGFITSSGTFTQSNGSINIDPNNNGNAANSTTSSQYTLNLSGIVQWTGGTLTLIDPPASTSSTHYSIYYSSASSYDCIGHTIVFGDGISSTVGGNAIGFLIYNYVGSGRLNFGHAVVNGPSTGTAASTNRIVQQISWSNFFNGNFTINNGGEFLNTNITVGGNVTVNSGGILTSTAALNLAKPSGSSSAVANTSAQTIGGSGTFQNLATSSTASLTSLTINNTSSGGVTISTPLSISGTLTMTAGKINTTATNILTLGTTSAAGTLSYTDGQIAGPFARTFAASRTATGTYTVATLYPVGDGTNYLPIYIDPSTTSTGATVMSGQVFNTNTGTAGAGVATTLSSKRWEALATVGSSNLTSSFIQMNDASIASGNIIAQSTSASGTYNTILPASTVGTGTIRTATAIAAANYAGYFTYAAPGPAITSFTPTSACPNAATTITITGTNLGSATAVTLNGEACAIVTNTATQLVVTTDATPQAGNIVVTTAANSATSANAVSLYTLPTVIASSDASSNTICSGSNITLNGGGASTYAWNNSVTNNVAFAPTSSTTYTVTGTDGNGCTNTASIVVTVNQIVAIATQPSSQVVLPNDNVIFSVSATGTGLSYQWQENTGSGWNAITNGGIYSGATTSSLTLTGVTSTNSGYQYQCVVSGTAPCSNVTSSSATLTISSTAISAHPVNQTICVTAGTATFSITTTGTTPSYQWQVSTNSGSTWADITNETSSSLSLAGLTLTENGNLYRCLLNSGSITSNSASLSVNAASVAGTVSVDQAICSSASAANITLSGNTGTIQWQVSSDNSSFANITNAIASPLTSAQIGSLSATRYYRAVVTNGVCSATNSAAVTITVTTAPNAGTLSGTQAVCVGATTTFSSNGDSGGAWSSSNASTASINSSGTVTGVAAGTATMTYTITGTGGCSNATATRTVTVNANPAITSATATPATVCSGSSVSLSAASVSVSSGNASVGSGASSGSSTAQSIFPGAWGGAKTQYLIKASELTTAGLVSGNISSIAFEPTSSGQTYQGFFVYISSTSLTALSSTFETMGTQVYAGTLTDNGFTPTANAVNTLSFGTGVGSTSSFNWNGTSNIIVTFSWSRVPSATTSTSSTMKYDVVAYNSTNYVQADSQTPAQMLAQTTGTTSTSRPKLTFGGQVGTALTSSYSWSWNTTPAVTSATGTISAVNNTNAAIPQTYIVTATNATTGCTNTATTSAITINPVPTTPSANSTSICGPQNATCSVTGSGTVGNTFKWYTVSTGGTAISGQTAATLSAYPISTTTPLYVSEANANCESARVAVIQTVTTPPSVTASASSATVCAGASTTLSATSANTGYTYTWNNSGGSGASVTVSPSATTTYTVTATDASNGANNGCSTTATTSVTVNPLPSAVTISPTTASICSGSTAQLSGSPALISNVSGYSTNVSTGASLLDVTGGTDLIGQSQDDLASALANIGFNFVYEGTTYTQFSANSNGLIRLGGTVVSTDWTNALSDISDDPKIMPLWDDVSTGTSGYVRYKLNGTSPNRILVVEFFGRMDATETSASTSKFQTLFYETSNLIEFVYGTSSTNPASATIGISGIINTNYMARKNVSNNNFGNSSAAETIATWPGEGTKYTFIPTPTYSWTGGSIASGASTATATVNPTATTTYTLTSTNSLGCSINSTATITVNQPTLTWTGATSTDPTVTTNWNPVALPCPVSDITVPGGLTNYPIYTSNLTISSGGSYTLQAGAQLTVNGTLTNNGTFTLQNGATFVQGTSGTSIAGTGTYNVEKALTDNSSTWSTTSGRFWYMGVPMVNVARSSYGTPGTTTNRLWSYTEATKSYTELSDGSALLSAGTGYVHRRSTDGTLTFSATGANGLYGSNYTASGLTKTAGYTSGVNLVSNPYMAYLDWLAVVTASPTIDPTFYIRSNNVAGGDISALISYNANTPTLFTNTSSVNITNASQIRYIAPMQSVWVKVAATASAGTINMTRGMLSHQSGNPGLKSSTVFPTLAKVNLVDGNRFDQMLVYMNSDMTNEVDQYDSEKLPVSGTVQLYTMASNKKLVMNGLKNNKKKVSVPLYLDLPASKSYTLQLADYVLEDGLILLEDKQEGTMQDFTLLGNYTFNANSGQLYNRFVLHFILPNAELTTQGPSNSWVGPETSYTDGGNVQITNDDRGNIEITVDQPEEQKVEGNVTVTDMNGKEIYKGQLDGVTTAVSLNVPAGIYYLTVQSGTLFEKKKVFIQD